MPLILCFVSERHTSGKTEAARHVAHAWGVHAVMSHFTDALKRSAWSLTDQTLDKDEPNELGVTARQIIEAISDAASKLHPELPVLAAKREILSALDSGKHVLIDDVRRPLEFQWLRSLGHPVRIIEVWRPPEHTSEDTWITDEVRKLWGDGRAIVLNDGTHGFHKQVLALCELLLEDTDGR